MIFDEVVWGGGADGKGWGGRRGIAWSQMGTGVTGSSGLDDREGRECQGPGGPDGSCWGSWGQEEGGRGRSSRFRAARGQMMRDRIS